MSRIRRASGSDPVPNEFGGYPWDPVATIGDSETARLRPLSPLVACDRRKPVKLTNHALRADVFEHAVQKSGSGILPAMSGGV